MFTIFQSNESNGDNLNNASRHFGNKGREYLKLKLMNLKQTVGTRISESYIGASVTLTRVTSLELPQYRMRRMI
jgi:hypothetical protein